MQPEKWGCVSHDRYDYESIEYQTNPGLCSGFRFFVTVFRRALEQSNKPVEVTTEHCP